MNRVRVTPHFLHRGAPRRRKIGGSFAGKFPQYCVKMLLTKPRWIGRTPRGGDVPISCNANSSKVLYPEFSSWKTQRAIAFICKGEREREREKSGRRTGNPSKYAEITNSTGGNSARRGNSQNAFLSAL